MRWRHFGAHFPCDVVVAEGGGASSAVVQLRFQALSGPQGAFMRELLGELEAA